MGYQGHPDLVTPSDDTVVWRYMDLVKLLDILGNSRLWFARMDLQDDPREGRLTEFELKELRAASSSDAPLGPAVHKAYLRAYEKLRRKWFLNCWTEGGESMAMWDLYARSPGGVAIKSTVGILKNALIATTEDIYIARTKYLDWNMESWENILMGMYFRKAFAFEHEKEVRMMIYREDSGELAEGERAEFQQLRDDLCQTLSLVASSEREFCRRIIREAEDSAALRRTRPGISADTTSSELIEEIVVGPRSEDWMVQAIKKIIESPYKISVRRSELAPAREL